MASAFGHAFTAIAIGSGYNDQSRNWKFLFIGIVCSVLPDADVLSFKFGIPYEAFWGHRGFTHSILFAVLLGLIATTLFYKSQLTTKKGLSYILFFIFCTLSHGMLDAMTTGGLGVGFFLPFDDTRYFFPWRPIKVSPIGASHFFSERGIKVIKSEAIWIGIPCTVFMIVMKVIRINKNNKT
jgi:inner membrane protein